MDRVAFDEIHVLLKTVRFSVEGKERIRGQFLNHPNFVIWEAEQVIFQNADILVDYRDQ